MARKVFDTNVAVVANGRDTHASPKCQIKAIDVLSSAVDNGTVVIDDGNQILLEYGKRLYAKGQPGVGDLFYRHVLDNAGNARKVVQVDLNSQRARGLIDAFEKGNLSAFDPSDRPFALCSVVAKAPVLSATDSDWVEQEAGLKACGVRISYVCGRTVAEAGGVE